MVYRFNVKVSSSTKIKWSMLKQIPLNWLSMTQTVSSSIESAIPSMFDVPMSFVIFHWVVKQTPMHWVSRTQALKQNKITWNETKTDPLFVLFILSVFGWVLKLLSGLDIHKKLGLRYFFSVSFFGAKNEPLFLNDPHIVIKSDQKNMLTVCFFVFLVYSYMFENTIK